MSDLLSALIERSTMGSFKEYGQAAILFAVMIGLFFSPVLTGRILSQEDLLYFFPPWTAVKPPDLREPSNPILADQTREFLTFFSVARESLAAKEFPLWNPYIMAGTPLLANSQSALLFPLNWAFYLLPFHLGFTVSGLLKLFIASLAMYAFGRRMVLSHGAAILAGTVYAFLSFNLIWLNHPHTNVTLFFPLLLLLTKRITEGPNLSLMGTLGLVVGLQLLGGHVEIAFQTATAVAAFFVFLLARDRHRVQPWLPRVIAFFGGYVLGFFLAAVVLFPFLEFLVQSATWHVRSEANPFSLSPLGLVSLFLPDFFIRPGALSRYTLYHVLSLYAGICPLVLSITALALRPTQTTLFFAGLSLFGLLVVFRVPPFFSLLTALPLFKQAPNYYMVLFHGLSVSLLSGMGLDLLRAERNDAAVRRRLRNVLIGIGLLAFVASLALLFGGSLLALSPLEEGWHDPWGLALNHLLQGARPGLLRSTVLLTLSLAVLVFFILRKGECRFLGVVCIGLTFIDLFLAGRGWNPVIPVQWSRPRRPPAIDFLHRDKGMFRVAAIGAVMPPNVGVYGNLQDIRGYDVPVLDRYHRFFQEVLKGKASWWVHDLPVWREDALDAFSLLNVRYILSLETLPPPLLLVYDQEVKIYRNPHAFPRAFLVHEAEFVPDGEKALERVQALGGALRRVLVVEGHAGAEKGRLTGPEPSEDRVQILRYRAREVALEVESPAPGFLVFSDTYLPGWEATVDGKKTPILRGDYLLRAVAVDAGKHHLLFRYRPLSFRVGVAASLSAAIFTLGCCILKRDRPLGK